MRKRNRIYNQRLVCIDGCVEKELDFTSITDVASQCPHHFPLIAKPGIFLRLANFSIR
jgi:hypothetical protein